MKSLENLQLDGGGNFTLEWAFGIQPTLNFFDEASP